MHKFNFVLEPAFAIILAITFLIFPFKWVIAWLSACFVHELSHCIALNLCRCRIRSISVHPGGAYIATVPLTNKQELFCALAGPVGGLLPVMLFRIFPRFAVCSVIHSCYNLLPVFPMDGGRAMRCILNRLFLKPTVEIICNFVRAALFVLVFLFGLFAFFIMKLGPLPLIFAMTLIFKCTKSSCKAGSETVQ